MPMYPQPISATRQPGLIPNRPEAWTKHATGSPSAALGLTFVGSFTSACGKAVK